MKSQQDIQAFVAWNNTFKRQVDIKTPLSPALINTRHPQTAPSFPTRNRTRVTVYHCNGMDIFEEKITDQYSRWTFGFPATAQLIAGWAAMNYGSSLAPVNAPANEIQTLAADTLAAGNWTISHAYEGRSGTLSVPYDITAAALKTLMETSDDLPTVEVGDLASVTGTLATGFVVTISPTGKLRNADITAFVTTGTGAAVPATETQKGLQRLHSISRATSPDLPKTSFIIGFEDDTSVPTERSGFVCDSLVVEASNRQDLTCTVELIGTAKVQDALGFIIPACVQVNPINTADCRLRVDGVYVTDLLSRFRWERKNNVAVGNEAFPWDGKDISLLWRGAKPTETMSFGIYGSRGDDIYNYADQELKKGVIFDIGVAGDRVSVFAPTTKLILAGANDGMTFDGELRRSVINVDAHPHFDSGINASTRVDAYIAQTAQFLTLPS